MNNSLESIVKLMEEKTKLANEEKALNEINNPYLKRNKKGQITRAKEDLKELEIQYRSEVKNRAVFILVTGSQYENFSKMAEEEFGCFSINAEEFYKDIVEKIPSRLYTNYISSPSLFDHIASNFENRAIDIGIVGYTALIFESKYKKLLKNKEDALELVKQAFNDKVGSEVVGLDAIDKITPKAIKEQFIGKTVPIVLYSKDESLIKTLSKDLKRISNNVFIISAGSKITKEIKDNSLIAIKTVDKENLEKSLLKIKENLN